VVSFDGSGGAAATAAAAATDFAPLPPPSLILPRTAVVAPPGLAMPPPSRQQQRFAPLPPPSPPQQQQPSWSPPSSASSPPPSPLVVVPRAGLMTVEERRAAFARAALRADASERAKELARGSGKSLSDGEQRTAEWHALRDARLTASAFGNALGFWPGGRESLWEEKVGLGKSFTGNAATQWGTEAEPRALEAFVAVSRLEEEEEEAEASSSFGFSSSFFSQRTRKRVSECRFEVLSEDDAHDWLGASPDGLIELVVGGNGKGGEEELLSLSSSLSADADGKTFSNLGGGGVLEIKCPFNRGSPHEAIPWRSPPHYYVPQVQGLMAITDREWCDLWCWTPEKGAVSFRFERDRGYWAQAFEVLADFWWAHVVPGNQAARAAVKGGRGGEEEEQQRKLDLDLDVEEAAVREALVRFRPPEKHPLTQSIVQRSKEMAERVAAEGPRRFSARELEEAIRKMG
jgi:hypothetical protein